MHIRLDNILEEIIAQYALQNKVDGNDNIYIEVGKGMFGLPQARILAQKLLEDCLNKHGHLQSKAVPGLWTNAFRPINFMLVVDGLGIKHVGKQHVQTC